MHCCIFIFFFFSSRRRHTRSDRDWSSDVCSSDLSGWIPDLTRCEAIQGFRIWSAVSVSLVEALTDMTTDRRPDPLCHCRGCARLMVPAQTVDATPSSQL